MSALTKKDIFHFMNKEIENRLVITPLFDPRDSFDASAVNVRLGNEFIVMRKQSFPLLNISDETSLKKVERYYEKITLRYREEFVLHPNQLIIGSTLEYICLPSELMCYVAGKSTWGRMGLIIATATKVDPGFKGSITLEIINEGEVPIAVYPGIPIAQLVFHKTTSNAKYDGIYVCPTGPEFPDFSRSKEKWDFWYPKKQLKNKQNSSN